MDDLDELARARQAAPYYYPRRPASSGWGVLPVVLAAVLGAGLLAGMALVYFNEHPIGGTAGGGGGNAGLGEVTRSRTADELMDEYRENEVAADESFRGHWVEVTGTVRSVRRDVLDTAFVMLQTRHGLGVECYFPEQRISQITPLKPGDQVVIRGRCEGMSLSIVSLKECSK